MARYLSIDIEKSTVRETLAGAMREQWRVVAVATVRVGADRINVPFSSPWTSARDEAEAVASSMRADFGAD